MSVRRKGGATLTHLDGRGAVRMVAVGGKEATRREAVATAVIRMAPRVREALWGGTLPKGEGLAAARVAGIQAAKRTAEWIPLCHVLSLDWVSVDFERAGRDGVRVVCGAAATARTGVEMEALVGAAAAALTVYDMVKGSDKSAVIGPIQLERKSGGRSGDYVRGG